ncbi:MAG: hypothetical protein JNL60_17345, partial [Bacteroidia bacterium]|nr:hypothetical protein [Bacteroidia bacterium]
MKSKSLLYFITLVFFISCHSETKKSENEELRSKIIGEWRSVSMTLNMNSFRNSDSSKVFEVSEANWESRMNIRPIRTIFRNNHTYNTEHWNL